MSEEVKVIAEIGINHNGSIEFAKCLADVAKRAGCDYVKLQKRDISLCYTPEELAKPCESPWGSTREDYLRGRELSWEKIDEFAKHCDKIGIGWSCSCFDMASFRLLHRTYGERLPWYKVPSGMAVRGREKYLLEIAHTRKLTLISTGLCDEDDMKWVARIFEAEECPYILNHCIARYPCPPEFLNLGVIRRMRSVFQVDVSELPGPWSHCRGIGYSGHEVGVMPSVIAAAFGATWIERHITIDRAMYGSDQAASLEPQGLQRLVRDVKSLNSIIGSMSKTLLGDEKNPIRHYVELEDG